MSDRKRVLFVCIGNACRSQMAEAFARAYGSDVLVPESAGVSPAGKLPNDTLRAMDEKNLDLRSHFPKGISQLGRTQFDLVINISGLPVIPDKGAPVREWEVADPIAMDYENHCKVRDQIETLVMNLILEFRREKKGKAKRR